MEELAVWAMEAESYFESLFFFATTMIALVVSFFAVAMMD